MPYWLGRCHLTAVLKQFLILRHEKGAEVMSMYKWPYIVRVSILLICSRCEGYLLDCSDTPCIAKPCDINSIVQRPYNVSQCYGYFCILFLVLWWEFFMWTPLKLSESFINYSMFFVNVIFTILSSSFFVDNPVETGEWKGLWILQSTLGTSDRKMWIPYPEAHRLTLNSQEWLTISENAGPVKDDSRDVNDWELSFTCCVLIRFD